jgi:hypothetical protein
MDSILKADDGADTEKAAPAAGKTDARETPRPETAKPAAKTREPVAKPRTTAG